MIISNPDTGTAATLIQNQAGRSAAGAGDGLDRPAAGLCGDDQRVGVDHGEFGVGDRPFAHEFAG